MTYNIFNQLSQEWKDLIFPNIEQSNLDRINTCYKNDTVIHNKIIYPSYHNIFKVFELLNPKDIKVIILGQDPYHGIGEANGIAFSIDKRRKQIPPSLRNIYKELNQTLNIEIPEHGDLTDWVKQGVFLLNSTLTVEQNKANSNLHYNWAGFTNIVIQCLSAKYDNLVFMLWGNYAKNKRDLIENIDKHYILDSSHPSPLSANRGGWFGNKHFTKTNRYLRKHSKKEIMWNLQ